MKYKLQLQYFADNEEGTLNTSSDKYDLAGEFNETNVNDNIPSIIATFRERQLAGKLPIITPYNNEGSFMKKEEEELKEIFKKSSFHKVFRRLIKERSIEGRTALAIDKIDGEIRLSLIDNIVRTARPFGQLTFLQTVRNVNQGTQPVFLTTTYFLNKTLRTVEMTIDESMKGEELDRATKEANDFNTDQDKAMLWVSEQTGVLYVREHIHNYGFIPAVVFENRPTDQDLGIPDYSPDLFWIGKNIDLYVQKEVNEFLVNTTEVIVNTNYGVSIDEEKAEQQRGKISGFFNKKIKVYGLDDDFSTEEPYTVLPRIPIVEEIQRAIAVWWARLYDIIGIKESFNKTGVYNETKDEVANKGDGSFQSATLQSSLLSFDLGLIVDMIAKINKWKNYKYSNVEIMNTDIRMSLEIINKPENFLKLGWSMSELLSKTLDISIVEAQNKLNTLNFEEIKNTPLYFLALTDNVEQAKYIKGVNWLEEKAVESSFNQGEGSTETPANSSGESN